LAAFVADIRPNQAPANDFARSALPFGQQRSCVAPTDRVTYPSLKRGMEEPQQPVREAATVERRSEPRSPACDPITVIVEEGNGNTQFAAYLVDQSQRGLCIRHQCKALPTGRRVRISLSGQDVDTEVVWSWSVGELVMSGLRRL